MLTNRTRAGLVQVLQSISNDACRLLLLKHLDLDIHAISPHYLLQAFARAHVEQVASLLIELIGNTTSIRTEAPTKYVFDSRLADLQRLLELDGYELLDGSIIRVMPAAEPAANIVDYLDETLSSSGLDANGEIRALLEGSRAGLLAVPPDFNGATTKARIALETIARRGAKRVADRTGNAPPVDQWGSALSFLRIQNVIVLGEEEALAKMYTLISPGAHVPKGLTDQQWALLSKTFAVSAAYFLLQRLLSP
jgi:hypothetical protein